MMTNHDETAHNEEHVKQTIKELTLLLLYLNSWVEENFGDAYRRSWKGHDFDVLNELADEELITDSRRSKSVGITDAGEELAKKLMDKYMSRR